MYDNRLFNFCQILLGLPKPSSGRQLAPPVDTKFQGQGANTCILGEHNIRIPCLLP